MIAIIPARGGSVRIKRKNIRLFHGRPIIEYAIETALMSDLFGTVMVSTDDDEIASIAHAAGAVVVHRSTDDGSKGTQAIAGDVLRVFDEIDIACVIYPTSPMLRTMDLHAGALALVGHKFAMSVDTEPLADAGCFYFGDAKAFRGGLPLIATHTAMVPLPPERCCDINTEADWQRAEQMYTAMKS